MRYHFIQSLVGQFSITALCRALRVSKSGYYAWCKRQPSVHQRENETITGRIPEHFEVSRQTYGSPRILRELREEGIVCGKHRVARLMRGAGLRALQPRRFQVTTDSKHALPVAENLLRQDFTASKLDERWAADITYLWTGEGWLYLAVVLDLFSRRIVGWSMQASLHKALVLDALRMAFGRRRPAPGLLHHSDRGSQYASVEFQEALGGAGIVCSMSRKGNCFDNAVVESFFGTRKVELVHRCRFATRQQARQEVFEYIELWCQSGAPPLGSGLRQSRPVRAATSSRRTERPRLGYAQGCLTGCPSFQGKVKPWLILSAQPGATNTTLGAGQSGRLPHHQRGGSLGAGALWSALHRVRNGATLGAAQAQEESASPPQCQASDEVQSAWKKGA